MVADGQTDIGFARLPSRNICVMHPEHGLSKSKTLTVPDLTSHDLILFDHERPVRHELEALFCKQGLQRPALEAHSVRRACALAAEGLGIAILSEPLAREYSVMPLVFVPLEPALVMEYAIVSSDQRPRPKSAAPFLRYLREWYQKPNITKQPSGRQGHHR